MSAWCRRHKKEVFIMYEKVKVIRLKDMEDVKSFVQASGDCDFEIDVRYNRTLIDAKSLLGMIALGVQKNLVICYSGSNEHFETLINKYAVV